MSDQEFSCGTIRISSTVTFAAARVRGGVEQEDER